MCLRGFTCPLQPAVFYFVWEAYVVCGLLVMIYGSGLSAREVVREVVRVDV